jgi:hypothetical protein
MEIITEQPLWYLILCLGTGAIFAFLLYYKERLFSDVRPWLQVTMAGLRFTSVSLLGFFLLSPLLKIIQTEIEKPIVIIAQDNSESIVNGKDSVYYKTGYTKQLDDLVKALKTKYTVKTYSFGNNVSPDLNNKYKEKQTNISGLLTELNNKYNNSNIGAIILATDGLYNQGSNPLYAPDNLKAPLFTIALGDTNLQKDVMVKKVNYNKIAYLGNTFPLEITIEARQCKGACLKLIVQKDASKVFEKNLMVGTTNYKGLIPVALEAGHTGLQHYKISVLPLEGEVTKINNTKDIYIEVMERRQKIMILANGAHPDVNAIKQCLEISQGYEVSSVLMEKFDGNLNNCNLLVLHQLPSISQPITALLQKIKASGIPVLYILGDQTSLPAFNGLKTGLTIQPALNKYTEAGAYLSPDFSSFMVSDELQNSFLYFPPLNSPFGTYKVSGNSTVFLKQQIGAVKTDQPLLLFTEDGASKTGVLAGEGIWAWRLRNFAEKNNHDAINELISKTVQYLALKENKSRFRITGKNNFLENEPVVLDATVFNTLYEPVNTGKVDIVFVNTEKKQFPFTFTKTENAFTLNAGMLPTGSYTYQATTQLSGKTHALNGQLSVAAIQAEAGETVADHHLLYKLSQKSGGEMVYPNQMGQITALLNARDDIRPVAYSHQKLNEIIHLKWILFLLIVLLSTEWFLRKRNGGY